MTYLSLGDWETSKAMLPHGKVMHKCTENVSTYSEHVSCSLPMAPRLKQARCPRHPLLRVRYRVGRSGIRLTGLVLPLTVSPTRQRALDLGFPKNGDHPEVAMNRFLACLLLSVLVSPVEPALAQSRPDAPGSRQPVRLSTPPHRPAPRIRVDRSTAGAGPGVCTRRTGGERALDAAARAAARRGDHVV
jgi:hypothetical protein